MEKRKKKEFKFVYFQKSVIQNFGDTNYSKLNSNNGKIRNICQVNRNKRVN